MPSQANIDQLASINQRLTRAKNLVLVDYTGLSVNDQTELRAKVNQAGGEFTVQKNTLLRLAITDRTKEIPESMDQSLNGPTAVLFGYEDAVSATKVAVEFQKDHAETFVIKAGLITGTDEAADTFLTTADIKRLADLPTKDQLRAQVVGTLNAPIFGFVNVLAGNIRGLVQVLSAVRDQQAN